MPMWRHSLVTWLSVRRSLETFAAARSQINFKAKILENNAKTKKVIKKSDWKTRIIILSENYLFNNPFLLLKQEKRSNYILRSQTFIYMLKIIFKQKHLFYLNYNLILETLFKGPFFPERLVLEM